MKHSALLDFCRREQAPILECLRRAVEIESPTHSPPGVRQLAHYLSREFRRAGGRVRLLENSKTGPAVVAEFWSGTTGRKPILLLGHLDTVWEVGTLAKMPFRVRGGRAYGPGILDMKSGIVCALWAIRALRRQGIEPASPVRFFLNADEETSSVAFREQLLREARGARAVLVLEPAAENGALKTSRKGVGEFRLTVWGRSAHAGINPQAGVNAISELARQLLRVEKLARPRRGLTLTPGTIAGGTRSNVVPEFATASIDVRVPTQRDRKDIERKMRALRPFHPEARLEIAGGVNRPPLERRMSRGLFRHAQRVARELGMELSEASTGGGSDGNFTAALSVPTLDGLGGVGGGAHARDEHVVIGELPRRAALIASLLATL